MSKKENLPVKNPRDQGAAVSVARQAAAEHARDAANRRLRERDEGGVYLDRVTPEQWEMVLMRIEAGDTDANIMRDLGCVASTLTAKRARDADFNARYNEAFETGWVNIAKDIRQVTRGVPGYSSGDVQRDRLIAKYDLELAKRFASRIIGDRLQVDQRTISINITKDDSEW